MSLKILSFIIILNTFTKLQCSENNIAIRPATLHDLDAITKLSHQHYEHEFKKLWEKKYTAITPSHHTTDSFVEEKMINANAANEKYITLQLNQGNNERFLVAELMQNNKKEIAGFCRFEKKDPQTMYINFVFVDKDYRKQGIGTLLARTAMNTFEGVTQCKFRALVHKESINNLYAKQGCNKVGTVALDPNTGKISTDQNAPITHFDYSYTIKK